MTKNLRQSPVNPIDIPLILKDVRESRCFGRSQRQMKLFEYLLEHSRADNEVQPSQYSIALDVIGRAEDFDAATDSIVRVEMHRLRANLDVYNNGESKYKISVPPASFTVEVSPRRVNKGLYWDKNIERAALLGAGVIAAAGLAFASIGPAPLHAADVCAKDRPNFHISYDGEPSPVYDYVKSVLSSTISQQTVFNVVGTSQPCGKEAAPAFTLQINALDSEERFNLSLNVLEGPSKTIVEAHHISGMMADARPGTVLYNKIIEVGNLIALPSGTTARRAYARDWGAAEYKRSYGCLISLYDSYAGEVDSEFENVEECLKRSITDGHALLDNYGALASIYLYQARHNRPSTVQNPFQAAKRILDEYGDRWIDSSEMAIAVMHYEAYRPDFNAERLLLNLGVSQTKYHTNPQVLLNAAIFYGYTLGKWDEAKALSDYVKDIYSIRDQSVFAVDAGYALVMHGKDNVNMQPCYDFYSEASSLSNIIVNSCARQAGNKVWLEKTEARLAELNMSNPADRINYISRYNRDETIVSRITQLQSSK